MTDAVTGPFLVSEGGLEPPRPFEHWHLKPARLPFRHSPERRYDASNECLLIHRPNRRRGLRRAVGQSYSHDTTRG